jgi:hypothetical protein
MESSLRSTSSSTELSKEIYSLVAQYLLGSQLVDGPHREHDAAEKPGRLPIILAAKRRFCRSEARNPNRVMGAANSICGLHSWRFLYLYICSIRIWYL